MGFTIDNLVSMVLHTLSEEVNLLKCTIGDHKNSLGKFMELYEVPHGRDTN